LKGKRGTWYSCGQYTKELTEMQLMNDSMLYIILKKPKKPSSKEAILKSVYNQ